MNEQVYYKFISLEKLERFLDYLAHNYLYGAKPKELNDPFEGRFNLKGLSKETKNNIYKKLNRTRICSMFKGKDDQDFPNDFLMWSHYANSHKGCCFEFTLTNQYNKGWTTKGIIYGVQMPAPKDDSDNSIYDILSHKTLDWKNENEVRAIKIYEEGKEGNSHFYHIKLRAVYFGLSADSKNTDILVRIINALNPNISIYQIRRDGEKRDGDYPSLKKKCLYPQK
jgi:hypothetical protein